MYYYCLSLHANSLRNKVKSQNRFSLLQQLPNLVFVCCSQSVNQLHKPILSFFNISITTIIASSRIQKEGFKPNAPSQKAL